MVAYELKSQTSVTTRRAAGEAQVDSSYAQDQDDAQLQRMGKKPVLKVRRWTVKTIIIIIFFFRFLLFFMVIMGPRQKTWKGTPTERGRKTRQIRKRNYQTNIC